MRKATIIDVANRAGVSWKTVSRVVNREANVRPATVERVTAAIVALDYSPNHAARSLASDRAFLIAALTANPSAHYSMALHRGAAGICRERGFHLALEEIDPFAPDMLAQFERAIKGASFHGAIVPPPLCNEPEVIALLKRYGVRCVLIDPVDQSTTHPFILADDVEGVVALVDHAIVLGHRRFAIVDGPTQHRAATARFDAYRAAVTRHLGPVPIQRAPGEFTFTSGMAAGAALLDRPDRPSFVFATNDDMAAGVIAAANRAGLSTPGDVSVAGFDDSDVAQLVWPPLTTISQPISAFAASAVDILTAGKPGDKDVKTRFSVELIVRGSTGPASTA